MGGEAERKRAKTTVVYSYQEVSKCIGIDDSEIDPRANIPSGSVLIPYEVCLGHRVDFVFTGNESRTKLKARVQSLAKSGSVGMASGKGFNRFESRSRGVARKSGCKQLLVENHDDFERCFEHGNPAPVLVRWRRIISDKGKARRKKTEAKPCKAFEVTEFSYSVREGLEPYMRLTMPGDHTRRIKGASGTMPEVSRVRPGEAIAYKLYDKDLVFDDMLHQGMVTVPRKLRDGRFGDGRITFVARCVSR